MKKIKVFEKQTSHPDGKTGFSVPYFLIIPLWVFLHWAACLQIVSENNSFRGEITFLFCFLTNIVI